MGNVSPTIVLIPSRLASTRLPNKPLADIHGEPMVVHVWRQAIAANVGDVFVACGDEAIAHAVEDAGGTAAVHGDRSCRYAWACVLHCWEHCVTTLHCLFACVVQCMSCNA